ncbi:MAG: hypothetical protein KBH01_01805 [Breznakibacter sp.]|nr:hypothetical protein [Breznakibacter sp.]
MVVVPPSCIERKVMLSSLCHYHQNNFALGLYKYFPRPIVDGVLKKYCVGTAKGNKTIFWQVNRLGEVRAGKVIQYSVEDIKRKGYINWAHKLLGIENFNLGQVFFGSHLLNDKATPVAMAEGEKNAILGALFYPQYNWIAVGSVGMLNVKKLNALKEYRVTLFPDKGKAFEKWSRIAEEACFDVVVNDVLEQTDLEEGDDIADLVLSIRKAQYLSSPEAVIDRFTGQNPNFAQLIKVFDLVVIPCSDLH